MPKSVLSSIELSDLESGTHAFEKWTQNKHHNSLTVIPTSHAARYIMTW